MLFSTSSSHEPPPLNNGPRNFIVFTSSTFSPIAAMSLVPPPRLTFSTFAFFQLICILHFLITSSSILRLSTSSSFPVTSISSSANRSSCTVVSSSFTQLTNFSLASLTMVSMYRLHSHRHIAQLCLTPCSTPNKSEFYPSTFTQPDTSSTVTSLPCLVYHQLRMNSRLAKQTSRSVYLIVCFSRSLHTPSPSSYFSQLANPPFVLQ